VPIEATTTLGKATVHTLRAGEKAILARLRTMTDSEFETLPYGSEGLWRKLMHAARSQATLEDIILATKSKRYTRTRIDRMILCAFLGISENLRTAPVPYCRILGFNDTGRTILSKVKDSGYFVNIGEKTDHPFEVLEHRSGALYGLFSEAPDPPTKEKRYRIIYKK
jgi:predicted nucleotidyltransferase